MPETRGQPVGLIVTGELLSAGGRPYTTGAGDRLSWEAKLLVVEDVITVRFRDEAHMQAALAGATERQLVSLRVSGRVAGPAGASRQCWIEYMVGNGGAGHGTD